MSLEDHKQAIKRYYEEAWNNKRVEVIDEIFEANYVVEDLPSWRKPGAEGLKEFVKDNHRMFPDSHTIVDDLVAEGDKVAFRISASATHKGDLVGPVGLVPATNKKVSWSGMFIAEFKNGKIVHIWGLTNNMELMLQLGAVAKTN